MRKLYPLFPIANILATAGGPALDIRGLTRFLDFTFASRNIAGTSPTLTSKLQTSPNAVSGYGFSGTTTPSNNVIQSAGITRQAITWTQSGAKSLYQIQLMLKTNGTIAAGKKVLVDIFANSGGAPTGSSLGQAIIDIDSQVTTAYDLVTGTFLTPVDVADATIYHAQISADYTASDTNMVTVQGGTVASGGNQSTYTPSSWTAVGTVSLLAQFHNLVFTDVSGGGFTQQTTALSTARQTLTFSQENLGAAFVRAHHTIGGTSSPSFYTAVDVVGEARLN